MKDERTIVLKNQITIGEVMLDLISNKPNKPYVAITVDGVYSFENKEEAQAFALERGGFFDTRKNISSSESAKKYNNRRWNVKKNINPNFKQKEG